MRSIRKDSLKFRSQTHKRVGAIAFRHIRPKCPERGNQKIPFGARGSLCRVTSVKSAFANRSQVDMTSDMTLLTFLLTDIVQMLRLVVMTSLPIALVVGVGIWIYVKRARRR
jgi:hypothetical protein